MNLLDAVVKLVVFRGDSILDNITLCFYSYFLTFMLIKLILKKTHKATSY